MGGEPGQNRQKSLTQRLNFQNILTSQLGYLRDPGERPIRIAYTQSGRPTAALIIDKQAILDRKLYQVTCQNLDEAHYLLAIINSNTLEAAVEDFMPKGLFGPRDLDKHLWKLPIPEYDADNETHVALSRLGRTAAQEAGEWVKDVDPAKARSALRNNWRPTSRTAAEIETAVGELLAAGLADQ